MKYAEIVKQKFGSTRVDPTWSFSECTRSDTAKWTHGYHTYPAKFIPQIVEKLIDEYVSDKDAHINDPFFGCGTTIITAISRGLRASGTDINGIAYLLGKVKSTPIEPDNLEKSVTSFLNRIKLIGSSQTTLIDDDIAPLIPQHHVDRINYWFPKSNKMQLGKILRIIKEEENEKIREFLLVGFSQILKRCSIWLQKSTKPTRDFNKHPARPYDALRKHLRAMLRGNKSFFELVPETVRNALENYLNIKQGDARQQPVPDDSVDLIVTSSPYVTSYEYADLHQLSTLWLDFAKDLKEYRRNFIGTAYKVNTEGELRSEIAWSIVDEMNEKSPKIAQEVKMFYADMEHVIDESHRILKPGGRCCYVIGNTALKGVNITNAEVFAESFLHSGLKLDDVIQREIPSKILPQTRDKKTGRFAASDNATYVAYPTEYIVIGLKE
ncbi:MAG: DNA methyltransferase [Candidatus Thorarchaeota archaeon]|jgi:DNA modification methylase